MSHTPIAYTYEADHHCPTCTESRFGLDDDGFIAVEAEDREGNPVGALFSWDEWWSGSDDCEVLACGDCGDELDRVHNDACTYSDEDLCQGGTPEVLGLEPAESYFDVAQGLYWFCVEYYDGTSDPLYRISCELHYRPAPSECGPDEDSPARDVYDALANGDLRPSVAQAFVAFGYDAASD